MKRKTFMFTIILILINIQLTAQPKISASEENYDFGDVVKGQKVQHDFVFTNEGNEDLVIEKVRASCGCTAADPGKDVLKPGESTSVKVQYNSAVQSFGQHKKYVYLFSNDPEKPQYRVSFTANVVTKRKMDKEEPKTPSLILDKKEHDFGTVPEGRVVDFTVKLKNTGEQTILIEEIKSSCGCAAAMLSNKELEPGQEGTLQIEFDSSNRLGKMTRTLTLHTNDPVIPRQTIVIYANVVKGES